MVSLLIIGSLYFVLFKTESDPTQQDNKTASSTAKKEDAAKSSEKKKILQMIKQLKQPKAMIPM